MGGGTWPSMSELGSSKALQGPGASCGSERGGTVPQRGPGTHEPVRKAGRGRGGAGRASRGSYSRYWGATAAAGPRSPSSRSFCRSGKQRDGVTCAAGSGSGPPPCRHPSRAPSPPHPCPSLLHPQPKPQPFSPSRTPQTTGAMPDRQTRAHPAAPPVLWVLWERSRDPPTPCSPPPHPHSRSSSVSWWRTGCPCPSPRSCTPPRWLPCGRADGERVGLDAAGTEVGGPAHPVPPTMTCSSTSPWRIFPPVHPPPRIISSFPG